MTKIPKEELAVFNYLDLNGVIVDVGARDDIDLYKLKPHCEYHLFEPSIEFFKKLEKKCKGKSNIHINNVGLGHEAETRAYNVKQQSFLRYEKGDTYEQHITTLDAYCAEKGITAIEFLKIDTEGFDYRVLYGGQNIIGNTRYIQFEYWDGVKKFHDVLSPYFHMYLMMEPVLRRYAKKGFQGKADHIFNETLIPLDDWMVHVIDKAFIPDGLGGNILCIKK